MSDRVNRFSEEFDEAFPPEAPKDYVVEEPAPKPRPDVPYEPPDAPLYVRLAIVVLFVLALVAMVQWPW